MAEVRTVTAGILMRSVRTAGGDYLILINLCDKDRKVRIKDGNKTISVTVMADDVALVKR